MARGYVRILDVHTSLTPADHQTHHRYVFDVPEHCQRLDFHVAYAPKRLDEASSLALAESALRDQACAFARRVGPEIASNWQADQTHRAESVRVPNLITISVDDASGAYRGAGHRQAADQTVFITATEASPGFLPGALPLGSWTLVLSVHTLVSPHCDLSIQIGADVPTSTP